MTRVFQNGLTEAAVLDRLHDLPSTALLTPAEASVYANVRMDLLRAWRCQGRGPAFVGRGHFVRYPKGGLDAFLAGHAGQQRCAA
jgi:hypothetical protein